MITSQVLSGTAPSVIVAAPLGLVFLSGISPAWGDEGPLPTDIRAQTQLAADHLQQVLAARGLGWGNVAKTLLYLTNIAERPAVRAALAERFGSWQPAFTVVQADALPAKGARLQLDVVAAG
jgi:2-iminobutanoate/2-iminopropanoate deaminase